jgi:hypothetical protein
MCHDRLARFLQEGHRKLYRSKSKIRHHQGEIPGRCNQQPSCVGAL